MTLILCAILMIIDELKDNKWCFRKLVTSDNREILLGIFILGLADILLTALILYFILK